MTYRQLLVKLQNLTDHQLNHNIKVHSNKSVVSGASTEGQFVSLVFDGLNDDTYVDDKDPWPVDSLNPVIVIN